MRFSLSYKTKQFFIVLIKLSIVVGAFYFIYAKLTQNETIKFDEFLSFLDKNDVFSVKTIIFLIILSGFNWFFEIIKWKYLAHSIQKISLVDAIKQSLAGLTTSLITPNRIGDYGAKALYYPKAIRKNVILLNLLGNVAQMTVTTILGVIGLLFFVNRYSIEIDYFKVIQFISILIIIGVFILFVTKQKWFNTIGYTMQSFIAPLKHITIKKHAINLLLSLARYLIFSFQFYYLLILFGVDIAYYNAMIVITSMYFLASIIPSISIFDVVIKGGSAVFLFGYLQVSEIAILSIVTLMWLLNFTIPALFGSYFVLNFKFQKSTE